MKIIVSGLTGFGGSHIKKCFNNDTIVGITRTDLIDNDDSLLNKINN